MKKLALTAVVASALFSSSSYAEENMFYIKAEGGVSFFPSSKFTKSTEVKDKDKTELTTKFKNSMGGSGSIGVGYYVMDNLRTELSFKYPFISEAKFNGVETSDAAIKELLKDAKDTFKPTAMAVFLKGYFDAYDFEVGKVSIGAGLGWAQVSSELKSKDMDKKDVTYKFDKKNNLAFGAGARISYNISEGVALEGGYDWTMYGKPKDVELKDDKTNTTTKIKAQSVQTHDIVLGLRFAV